MLLELLERNIPESASIWIPLGQNLYPFIALFAAAIVCPTCVIMLYHCVADHQSYALRNRNQFVLKRAAVEQQCVPSFTQAGNKLVHDADSGSYKLVFGRLAQSCDIGKGQLRSVEAHQCERTGHLDCCRRTESGADRNLTPYQQAGARHRMSAALKHYSYAQNVIGPNPLAAVGEIIQGNFELLGKLF